MSKTKEKIKLIVRKGSEVKAEVSKKIVGYITAGFGVVAGLAWNDAIKAFIEKFFPSENGNILAKFAYAIIITIVVVVVSLYLVKLIKETEIKKDTPAEE